MRVLNVQIKYMHGGNPQVCLDYTRVLINAGNEVTVLTNPQDPFLEKHKAIGAEVIKSKKNGSRGSYDILSILYFKKILAQVKPDVVIVHDGRSAPLMKRAAGKNYRVIDANHGRSPKQSKKTDATIVTNKKQFERNLEFFSGINHQVFYLPNSIDLSNHTKPKFPKKWQSPPIIGTIGRLVSEKGLDIFIDALAILKNRGVDFKVKMGGDGDKKTEIEKQIADNGLKNFVDMVGWIKNPDEFYQSIDIFCFPSRREEFGLVLLEAYKNGLPAVVSDAEGPFDIVKDGVDALMVPKENPQMLADALEKVIKDKKLADSLAKAGYEKLINQYSVPVIAGQLQDILENTCINLRKKAV